MAGRTGVVSFDLDETLWEFMPMMDGALAVAVDELRQREPSVGPIEVAELHRVRAEVAEQMEGTYEELRRESFRRVLAEHGAHNPELSSWMVERWMEARVRTVRLLDDVEPAMDALTARGYLLGAITNGNFPLHRLPLAGRLAFIVHAEHVGEEKPAAAPFARAAELAGIGSERVGARWRQRRVGCAGCAALRSARGLAQPARARPPRGRAPRRRAAVAGSPSGDRRPAARPAACINGVRPLYAVR